MKLQLPLKGLGKEKGIMLTQKFGENPQIYGPQFGWKGHNGIDWAAPKGTPVYAIADGYVIEAITKASGYGLRISQYFETDKQYVALYAHFDSLTVAAKDWDYNSRTVPVKKGQVIGYVDSTGFSTGHHLHLTISEYKNGVKQNTGNGYNGALDPEPYFESIIFNTGKETYYMNDYVKTINLDGEVAGYVPLRNDLDIDLFNKIFNKNLVKNPDGSIPTDLYATKK